MGERVQPAGRAEDYRRGYLKLRSVLFDRATELPAYTVHIDALRAALDERRCVGLLHVEILNLSQVESLYGWQVVDRIVSRAAAELREAARRDLPPETLLGMNRVAGDSFALFLTQAPAGEQIEPGCLGRLADKLRRRLERSFADAGYAGLGPDLEFRAGHAMLARNPFYRFERRVHAALEEARLLDVRREQRSERSWDEELRRIIRDTAMETLFQPIVDLRSRAVVGHEAFARGPKNSPLESPRELFAASSRVGAEADLDRACRQAALQASRGMAHRGKIFLNAVPDGVNAVEQLRLEELSVDPADLVFEFSERCADADADLERLASVLQGLQARGFGVALDDVGTGYGSQALLELVRPDYLKLDVSLVHNIDENLIKQELLASLVRIAGRIGAAVIAEGVETDAEARTLEQAGARYAQGYLFAAPAPAATVGSGS